MWKVSWQICVASLQESVGWVYRRFHRWCNNSWEDGRIASTKHTTNLCNLFFKKYSTSLKKRSATLLSSGPSTCAKTSLNTADQPLWIQQTIFLKKAFVCLRKSGGIYNGRIETNGVFWPQDNFTLPYLSGLIWINPKPKGKNKDLATTLVSGLVARPLVFCFFWFLFVSTKGRHMPILP